VVSRFDGRYEVVYETTTAGVTIQSPQLDLTLSQRVEVPVFRSEMDFSLQDPRVPGQSQDLRATGGILLMQWTNQEMPPLH